MAVDPIGGGLAPPVTLSDPPRVRLLLAPEAATWLPREQARYAQGKRQNAPELQPRKVLGIDVGSDGIARVPEDRMVHYSGADGRPITEPLWHQFVLTLHFQDMTPEDQPPQAPLPGWKPYRGTDYANPNPDRPRPTRNRQYAPVGR